MLLYAPSTVTATVGEGTTVQISEETDYPFDETAPLRCGSRPFQCSANRERRQNATLATRIKDQIPEFEKIILRKSVRLFRIDAMH